VVSFFLCKYLPSDFVIFFTNRNLHVGQDRHTGKQCRFILTPHCFFFHDVHQIIISDFFTHEFIKHNSLYVTQQNQFFAVIFSDRLQLCLPSRKKNERLVGASC